MTKETAALAAARGSGRYDSKHDAFFANIFEQRTKDSDPQYQRASAVLAIFVLWLVNTGVAATELAEATAVAKVKQIIAHRGASAERPECTLAAIRRAIEVGATAVEVDVRTSKAGQLFILHDTKLDRTTNAKGPANALTLAQRVDARPTR